MSHHGDMGTGANHRTAAIWLWPEFAAYLGPSLHLDAHATAVNCYALGVDSPFDLFVDDRHRRVRSALIPARTAHRVIAGTGRMLFFYHFSADRPAHPDEAAVLAHLTGTPDPRSLCRLRHGDHPGVPRDPRIARAVEMLTRAPEAANSAAEIAAALHLSRSYFLHLFTVHTGTSFRRYRLWARLIRAGRSLAEGHELTRAAADAGFASPSHFSDTFHALFGLTATALLTTGPRIVVPDDLADPRTGLPAISSIRPDDRESRGVGHGAGPSMTSV